MRSDEDSRGELRDDPLADPRGEDEAIQDAIDAAVDDLYIRDEAKRLHSADKTLEFRQIDLDGLWDLPQPDPMIEGVLDWGTVTMLSGPRGPLWMGHETVQGSVLYVAAEGAHGQAKRVEAWLAQHKVDAGMRLIIDPVNLSDSGQVDQLVQIVHDGEHHLVIIDTLAKCTAGEIGRA